MGRPLRKDVNGVDVIGTFGTNSNSEAGIRVEFFDTQLRTDGIIIKQRGSKTFVVAQNGTPLVRIPAVLQAAEPTVAGQMRMQGFVGQEGNASNLVAIAKITKRVATDFSNNRYTWQMVNFDDSTGDVLLLTPVA